MSHWSKYSKVLLVMTSLAAAPATAGDVGEFGGPIFDLATAPNGDLLVADASVGIIRVRHRELGPTIALPGVTSISPIRNRSMWAVTGAGGIPPDGTIDSGQALHRISRNDSRTIVNLFEFEAAYNPHVPPPSSPSIESNPFDVYGLGGEAALVADAAGNDLLKVQKNGHVSVLAVFPNELVPTTNLKALAGCPVPPESPFAGFCNLPDMIPAQAVPTSIAVGKHGHIYVGELKGFPAPVGRSGIWRVSPGASWAQCGQSPDCVKVFDGGFTSIIDMKFGDEGKLYVAEMDESSWAAVEIFGTVTGGTVNRCNVRTQKCKVVADDIPMLTAITFGKKGQLYATRNALVPGAAEVIRLRR